MWNGDRVRSRCAGTALCLVLAGALLSACETGGGGTDDPVVNDYPIAYIKRPLYDADNEPIDFLSGPQTAFSFSPGGDLYLRDRAAPSAEERNISFPITQGNGDVSDPEVSYDGTKIVFAAREPEIPGADPEDQPTWNIWEYTIATGALRRIIQSDIVAEDGDDVDPTYLADGRILFSSNRQRRGREILTAAGEDAFQALDEDRNDPAIVLHVMESTVDSPSDIQQITLNASNDRDPALLDDGRVIFTRWDHMGGRNEFNLYTSNPDGTALNVLYGAHSHTFDIPTDPPGRTLDQQFLNPRQMEDGRIMVTVLPPGGSNGGGDLVLIDIDNFVEINMPTLTGRARGFSETDSAQDWLTTTLHAVGVPSRGRFAGAYPMYDGTNRLLVSWTPCRLLDADEELARCDGSESDPDAAEADPFYGVYVLDLDKGTQLPVVVPTEGVAITDPIVVVPRDAPEFLPDNICGVGLDQGLCDRGVGLVDVRSVYDTAYNPDNVPGVRPFIGMSDANLVGAEVWPTIELPDPATGELTDFADIATLMDPTQFDGDPTAATLPDRPARFVRVIQSVPTPPEVDDILLGRINHEMRSIVGYAPIEPDGSFQIAVPPEIPFALEVVDNAGRKFASHTAWLQVKAGETLRCHGCHNPRDGRDPLNAGAATSGARFHPNTEFQVAGVEQFPQITETMAQMRARLTCVVAADCSQNLSMDLAYEDVWTDADVRAPDPSYTVSYLDPTDGLSTPSPVTAGVGVGDCNVTWSTGCRIVINYEQHIQPIWDASRPLALLDQYIYNGVVPTLVTDNQCSGCHSGANIDTSDTPAFDLYLAAAGLADNGRLRSYEHLLTTRTIDGTVHAAVIDQLSSRRSYFFEFMTGTELLASDANHAATTSVDHSGMLTAAELKLIAEWVDQGGQYNNTPSRVVD